MEKKELTIDELKALVERQAQELEVAEEVIDDLKEKLKAAQNGSLAQTVTLGEDTYEVTSPDGFRWKGKHVSLDDLRASEDLVQALVDAGAGVLVKVEKPAKAKKEKAA
ncbi:hypothetical protein [Spirosoma litoris]